MIKYTSKDPELNLRLGRSYRFLETHKDRLNKGDEQANTFTDFVMVDFYLDKVAEELKSWPCDQEYSSWFVSAARDTCEGLAERLEEYLPKPMAESMIKRLKKKIVATGCDINISLRGRESVLASEVAA